MEHYALAAGHMAWFYADTIRDIMVKGFALMRTASMSTDMSGEDFRQSSSSLVSAAQSIQSDFALIEYNIAAPVRNSLVPALNCTTNVSQINQSLQDGYGRLRSIESLPSLVESASPSEPISESHTRTRSSRGIRNMFRRRSQAV